MNIITDSYISFLEIWRKGTYVDYNKIYDFTNFLLTTDKVIANSSNIYKTFSEVLLASLFKNYQNLQTPDFGEISGTEYMKEYIKYVNEFTKTDVAFFTKTLDYKTVLAIQELIYNRMVKYSNLTSIEFRACLPTKDPFIKEIVNFLKEKDRLELGTEFYTFITSNERKTDNVKNIISFYTEYLYVLKEYFCDAASSGGGIANGISKILKDEFVRGFTTVVNKHNTFAKDLAVHLHEILRKNSRIETSDSDLENMISLFGMIQNKDIFEHIYQNNLSQRLLTNTSSSDHYEKFVLSKLKVESGYQWTNKIERMFTDIQSSKDSREHIRVVNGIEFKVHVLTQGIWPLHQSQCHLHVDLIPLVDSFTRSFISKEYTKKLGWIYDQGIMDIEVCFSKGVKRTVQCTTFMGMILLALDAHKGRPLSMESISTITGVHYEILANHILSLCHPAVKVLLKNPNIKELEPSHQFMINSKFTSELLRVNVPLLSLYSTSKEDDEMKRAIELQRNHIVDCNIVRIMKTRKELGHNLLVIELVKAVAPKFMCDVALVKKRIDALIEQEYIERKEDDRTVYQYLA